MLAFLLIHSKQYQFCQQIPDSVEEQGIFILKNKRHRYEVEHYIPAQK